MNPLYKTTKKPTDFISSHAKGVADMITLNNLSEESLLDNIHVRFSEEIIYTYTGSILVAVNPYREIDIYNPDIANLYATAPDKTILPPHVFAVADSAYVKMREQRQNQSILISGESGSGKTETTKLILRYLASRHNKTSHIEQALLEISPILEAFGNAKTVRNDNSSRFGKYIEVGFNDSPDGIALAGAKVIQYLLEKSRIVHQADAERNYHVFFQMLAGLSEEEKKALKLPSSEHFIYLNQNLQGQKATQIATCDAHDEKEFNSLRDAFFFLSIGEDKQMQIYGILAAILHLGNIKMLKSGDQVSIENPEVLKFVAQILGVDANALQRSLLTRRMSAKGSSVTINLKLHEAMEARDALAKTLYSSLFQWLVKTINQHISPGKCRNTIGILDIFGYENFQINSLEQLCINFCNEKLQQHFNQFIFKLEQEEYIAENIDWRKVDFVDNQDCLNLIEKKPLGIATILDEESRFPQATDVTFLDKLHANFEKNAKYSKPKFSKNHFGIKHYAGLVEYCVDGFLDKNRDSMPMDIFELCVNSKSPFVSALFDFPGDQTASPAAAAATVRKGTKASVIAQFKDQLNDLMSALSVTSPSFIRCIKPNMVKKADIFTKELVLEQLRYTGMLATVSIRKNGYGMRFLFTDFYNRYRVLTKSTNIPKNATTDSARCDALCKHIKFEPNQMQKGKTKIFLKDNQYNKLELERTKVLHEKSILIQKTWKMFRAKKRYRTARIGIFAMQTNIRRLACAKKFEREKKSALSLQKFIRGILSRKQYAVMIAEKRKRDEEERKRVEAIKKKQEEEMAKKRQSDVLEAKRLEELAKKKQEEEAARKKKEEEELAKKKKEEEDEKKGGFAKLGRAVSKRFTQKLSSSDVPTSDPATSSTSSTSSSASSSSASSPSSSSTSTTSTTSATTTTFASARLSTFMPGNRASLSLDALNAQANGRTLRRGNSLGVQRFAQVVGDAQAEMQREREEKKPAIQVNSATLRRTRIGSSLALKIVDSDTYTFSKYAEASFRKLNNKTKQYYDIAKRFTYSLVPLEDSLKQLEPISSSQAVDLFQHIIKYMEETPAPNMQPRDHAQKAIQMAITNPLLRDEIYAQLIKQTTKNPKLPSLIRGWELMLLASGCFAPSKLFINYLLAHIQEASASATGDVSMLAVSTHGRIVMTLEKGERLAAPSYYEMQCSLSFAPIQCTIELPYYSTLSYAITPHTTSKDVMLLISDSLWVSLEDLAGFALYVELPDVDTSSSIGTMLGEFFSGVKIFTDAENTRINFGWRSLQPNQVITDVWRFVEEYAGQQRGYVSAHFRMKLLRKTVRGRWPPMAKPDSAIFEKLEVAQAYQEIVAGKYPTSVSDNARLAALYLQLCNGDIDKEGNSGVTELTVKRYVRKEHTEDPEVTLTQIASMINIAYQELKGTDKSDATSEFLSTLRRKWSLYGASLFFVKQHKAPHLGWLAVSQKGIDLLSYPNMAPVKSWAITAISSWNSEVSSFHFSSGSLFSPVREHFQTHEALEIASVLSDYISYLASLSPPSSSSSSSSSTPRTSERPGKKDDPQKKRASMGFVKKTLQRATSNIQIGRTSNK